MNKAARNRLGIAIVLIAVASIAIVVVVLRRDDSSDSTSSGATTAAGSSGPKDSRTGSSQGTTTVAIAGSRDVRFDNDVIDADPPSGDGCCLDVIATGDVDHDGAIDVIVGSEAADGLSWYRSVSGSPWTRYVIGAGDFTTDAKAADFDEDGDLDIVASSIDRTQIEWWEQIGDPTTTAGWASHRIGAEFAHDLILADLNGDGHLDVAAMHYAAGFISWHEAPADPTLDWTTHLIAGTQAEGVAAADLDGDGDQDLVAGPSIYINDGSGATWSTVPLAADWSNQARPALGDINGDGQLDVVLSHDETEGRLSWFSGPDWTEHVIDPDAGFSHSLALGDVDGDGQLDVMVGVMHTGGSHLVRVLFGDGGASWKPLVLADWGTHNAQLVDLDGDGRLDVVGKNYDGPKQVEIWWNRVVVDVPEVQPTASSEASSPLDGFQYVQVDDARGVFRDKTAFFGLAFGDLNGDDQDDIVSGGYAYLNPGGDMSSLWERVDLSAQVGTVVDAMLVVDVDGDENADVIAEALPDVWWLETNDGGHTWAGQIVASVPATSRPNGQGYRLGDLTGDGRPEIVLSGGNRESEDWYVQIPARPEADKWPAVRITETATDEQIGIGDIDGDGDNDVVAGDMNDGGAYIAWFENAGDGSPDWVRHRLGAFEGVFPDRLDVGDLDGDGRLDVIVTEENEGTAADAEVMWYRQPSDPKSSEWQRNVIVTQFTTNGLDVADMDGDGDLDLATGEHRGTKKVAIWENAGPAADGAVTWIEHPVDTGKETHLGARVDDLDGDGDLDIVSIGFDDPRFLHLWIND